MGKPGHGGPAPDVLAGPRTRLTRVCIDDAKDLFALVDANRQHLSHFLPWPATIQSVEDEAAFIEKRLVSHQAGTEYLYVIRTAHNDQAIGMVGVFGIDWTHKAGELGYWLGQQACGHGYMTEAVSLVQDALFSAGLHRLVIQCEVPNETSANIAARLGYQHEGLLREAVVRDGRARDMQIYSRLSTDD